MTSQSVFWNKRLFRKINDDDDGNNHDGITALQKGTSEHPINLASCILYVRFCTYYIISIIFSEEIVGIASDPFISQKAQSMIHKFATTRITFILALILSIIHLETQAFLISAPLQGLARSAQTNNKISAKMTNQDETKTEGTIKIVPVKCDEKESSILREGVAELFKAYFDELYELGCDLGFQGFQNEWIDLPGKYDFEKRGGLFVAVSSSTSSSSDKEDKDITVVGCIAIRPLEDQCGEVKRMFIRKSHRRSGIGKLLAETIVDHAWELDYNEIKLDSLERLKGAVSLYENLGFQRIDPYCECPESDHVCMNLFRETKT